MNILNIKKNKNKKKIIWGSYNHTIIYIFV